MEFIHIFMNQNSHNTEWETWLEAFQLFLYGMTLRSCIPVAMFVGLLLSIRNSKGHLILKGKKSL